MKFMTGGYSDPMAETKLVAERMVAMAQIVLVTKWPDLPPVGEEYCCNRKICYKPSLQLMARIGPS